MNLEAPPYFALIRGPFRDRGYEVATLSDSGETTPSVLLLFTTEEKAGGYRQFRPQGRSDWKVGPLPDAGKLLFFLESMAGTVKYFCLDYARNDPEVEPMLIPLMNVLPALRMRAGKKK